MAGHGGHPIIDAYPVASEGGRSLSIPVEIQLAPLAGQSEDGDQSNVGGEMRMSNDMPKMTSNIFSNLQASVMLGNGKNTSGELPAELLSQPVNLTKVTGAGQMPQVSLAHLARDATAAGLVAASTAGGHIMHPGSSMALFTGSGGAVVHHEPLTDDGGLPTSLFSGAVLPPAKKRRVSAGLLGGPGEAPTQVLNLAVPVADKNRDPQDTNFKCTLCSAVFPQAYQLEAHLNAHQKVMMAAQKVEGEHDGGMAGVGAQDARANVSPPPAHGAHARKRDPKSRTVSYHLTGNDVLIPVTAPPGAPSPAVQRATAAANAAGVIVCGECGVTFPNQSRLKAHQRSHTTEKPYKCLYCDAAFTWQTSQKLHMRIHTGEKPYACQDCDSRFASSSYLKAHIRRVHTKEKPYQCKFCDQRFSDWGNMRKHQRTHTKEALHRCHICGESFDWARHLRMHLTTMHPNAQPPPLSTASSSPPPLSADKGPHALPPPTQVHVGLPLSQPGAVAEPLVGGQLGLNPVEPVDMKHELS